MDLRHPPPPGPETRRQGVPGRPVGPGLRGAQGHRPVGAVEGAGIGPDLVGAPGPAPDPDVAVLRRPPQALAARPTQGDKGIDRPGMEPVRAEIEGMAAQGDRVGAAADPVTRLQHRHRDAPRRERPGGTDPGGAGPDHQHRRIFGDRREAGPVGGRARRIGAPGAGCPRP